MPEVPVDAWESLIQSLPEGHLLQTGAWGKLKEGLAGNLVIFNGSVKARRRLERRFIPAFTVGWRLAYILKAR